MRVRSIEESAAQAEQWLSASLPNVTCIAQEWDERIDCWVRLADGSLIGEKIPIVELSESRVLATGQRLKQRIEGNLDALINEIQPPIRVTASATAIGIPPKRTKD